MSQNTEQVVDLIDWLGVDLGIIDKKRKDCKIYT